MISKTKHYDIIHLLDTKLCEDIIGNFDIIRFNNCIAVSSLSFKTVTLCFEFQDTNFGTFLLNNCS